jgi:hypothetical protein
MKLLNTVLWFSVSLCAAVSAQELTLFEPIESAPAEEANPLQAFTVQNGQPAFTVRSTTRIGSKYKAVLVDRTGQQKVVEWQNGAAMPVPDAMGFSVSGIDSRSITLQHPANDPCVASTEAHVNCLAPTTSQLTISTGAVLAQQTNGMVQGPQPLPPSGPMPVDPNNPQGAMNPFEAAVQAQNAAQQAQLQAGNGGGQQGVFVNPFSGQAEVVDQENVGVRQGRELRQRARMERLNNAIQRIPPEQIPQGMRAVSTPFGDRLVPE